MSTGKRLSLTNGSALRGLASRRPPLGWRQDLGGRRCQAYLIANDPAAADPVCAKSPQNHRVQEAVARASSIAPELVVEHPLVFREPANSRLLSKALAEP